MELLAILKTGVGVMQKKFGNFQLELNIFYYTRDESTRFMPNIDGAHMIYGLASYVSLLCAKINRGLL